MIVSEELRKKHESFDPEAAVFLDYWDEKEGSKVLEVGANNSPLALMLAESGFDVTGIDLRPYDQPDSKHKHIVGDFLSMPDQWWAENRGTFDSVLCISALEHFGLGTYEEAESSPYMDVITSRYVWDSLKVGGCFYLSVPFGGRFIAMGKHYRVYDYAALLDRIVQDFSLEVFSISVAEAYKMWDKVIQVGQLITMFDAVQNINGAPYISAFLKLRKWEKKRIVKEDVTNG